MKTALKIIAALIAIAGVVYVVMTYGDKIAAWVKKLLGKGACFCCCEDDDCCCCEEEPSVEAEEMDFEAQA